MAEGLHNMEPKVLSACLFVAGSLLFLAGCLINLREALR